MSYSDAILRGSDGRKRELIVISLHVCAVRPYVFALRTVANATERARASRYRMKDETRAQVCSTPNVLQNTCIHGSGDIFDNNRVSH
jgi:hypothetical protein